MTQLYFNVSFEKPLAILLEALSFKENINKKLWVIETPMVSFDENSPKQRMYITSQDYDENGNVCPALFTYPEVVSTVDSWNFMQQQNHGILTEELSYKIGTLKEYNEKHNVR